MGAVTNCVQILIVEILSGGSSPESANVKKKDE